ncbi:MarR family transcriptional regulator [Propionibacteriaceae bacterium G1746]
MNDLRARRAQLLAAHVEAMREFNAYAVLLQDGIARSAGLNGVDLQVVGVLMAEGPATPGVLAARSGLSSGGAITALIDRLERAGYVTRRRDEADRRRVLVDAVPEKVHAEVGPIYGRLAETWGEFLATLTDEQIAFANALLEAATTVNREEIEHLRGTTARHDPPAV